MNKSLFPQGNLTLDRAWFKNHEKQATLSQDDLMLGIHESGAQRRAAQT